jgi:eukaryotic-like serine/threonine-protein kinase
MGVVHSARDRHKGALVAIKRPWFDGKFEDVADSLGCFDPRKSLAREYVALSMLSHPNIVRGLDFGWDLGGEPFLVLELLEHPRPINAFSVNAPPRERIRALVEMFEAIAYVHQKSCLHRDIKPSNVIVCRAPQASADTRMSRRRVCLIDFGLAFGPVHTTAPHERHERCPPSLPGSVLYLAPEVVAGASASIASDIYSAGMVTAEVLTGLDPRDRAGPRPTFSALRDLPRAWIADSVNARRLGPRAASLLIRLLATDPKERAGGDEAITELEKINQDI